MDEEDRFPGPLTGFLHVQLDTTVADHRVSVHVSPLRLPSRLRWFAQQAVDESGCLGMLFGERNVARSRTVGARLLRVDRHALRVQELDDFVPALERGTVRDREARDARALEADRELGRAAVERRAGREQ